MNERMNRKKLNVGTYILDEYARTERHIKELADCGIDFVTCMSYDIPALDLFAKYGVGAVVNGILPGWWGGDGDRSGKMAEINKMPEYEKAAKAFADHPAIWGIDTGDEPSALDFDWYGRVIEFTEKAFPHQFAYLNLYPNYASVAENTASQTVSQLGTPTYAEHIDEYVRRVPTDYICYDHYMYALNVPGAYENLRIVANACRESGRSLWIVLQVNSNRPELWITENQLRHQAYSAMAFGAENIIWACWTAGWWHNQVLDDKGEKTEQYEKLKAVNAELHDFSELYMSYRGVSTAFIGFGGNKLFADKVKQKPVEILDVGAFQKVHTEASRSVVAGHMVSREISASEAMFFCDAEDPDDKKPTSYKIFFTVGDTRVPKACRNGKPVEVKREDDGEYSVEMRSCGGILVTI